ncbi:FTR1 family protein [Geobacter sp. DSM 9736]|uniref:FTR1 family iron permease n=1 Tax=Geobacter sp. DSM 9736 TaxID=1277350 RepID=UPI000B50D0DD|nr:FTR1 family protein [Geobacter sp. DSM 9736]SNB45510.1 high-affinity iron transporter [Geobacter sp. DSM 9736]
MKRTDQFIKALCIAVVAAVMVLGAISDVHARPDYKGMVEEIGTFLNEALVQYKKGNVQEAKQKAQGAYFQVYENLEGPIRINISAKLNTEMEGEFIDIRKMIVAKEPAAAIEKRINDFMAKLRALVPQLEGGVVIVAESGDATTQNPPAEVMEGGANVEPVWLQAVDNIQSGLKSALETQKKGDAKGAAEQVQQTQFDHYKNSLLETAVRRFVSQKKDFENNFGFTEIIDMIKGGAAPDKVETRTTTLLASLKKDLPGLPLIEGAVSKREAGKLAEGGAPAKDWSKVTAELFDGIDRALVIYENGDVKSAIVAVQDSYFDFFEGSGMESKLGARDVNFKARLEGHFSMIVGKMKSGAAGDDIRATLVPMRADFDKAAAMLGKGKESAATLFFYSLMIILREGIEAILIISAIIAYLAKTGNRDKLKVIYNGCISALALSAITAVLVKWVFKTSAASQEILEGATMLLAAAVLFSVSYWLVSKANAQKWSAYIKEKVGSSISANSLRALWVAAFLAVYREGAETVLFYQALAADSSSSSSLTAITGGFLVGSILLVAVYLAMSRGAMQLPIKPFFLFTGALLYYMAFVFTGKGMAELISGKVFEPVLIPWMPTVELVGVYPYLQTLVPQLAIVLAAAAGMLVMGKRKCVTRAETTKV